MTPRDERPPTPRPGAMTAAMSIAKLAPAGATALRIGIVQSGRLVHDRLFQGAVRPTFGSHESNTFVVHGDGVPRSVLLAQRVGDAWCIEIPSGAVARVVRSAEHAEAGSIASSTSATCPMRSVVLERGARAKLSAFGVSMLFEIVETRAHPLRPELPTGVRGGLASSIDWLFTGFVLASFLAHFGFVAYLENADFPIHDASEEIVRTARLILESPEDPPVEPPPVISQHDSGDARPPSPSEGGEKPTRHDARDAKAQGPGPSDGARIEEAVRDAQIALLGSFGSPSPFVDLLRDGAPSGSAEELLDLVQGAHIATRSEGAWLSPRDVSAGSGQRGLDQLALDRVDTRRADEGPDLGEREVRAKVAPGELEEEGGSGVLDPAAVTRAIKRQLGRIRSCYEAALRHDPSLAGKVVVQFSVEQTGTLSKVRIDEDNVGDAGLSRCIVDALHALRLEAGPSDGSVDLRYPFVFERGDHR